MDQSVDKDDSVEAFWGMFEVVVVCVAVAVLGVISDCQHCVGKCFNMSGSGLG